MKKQITTVMILSMACSSLALNSDLFYDLPEPPNTEGIMCVHVNIEKRLVEKYAIFRNNTCPDYNPANAQRLTDSELERVSYDVAPYTDFSSSFLPRLINLSPNRPGLPDRMFLHVQGNDLHDNRHNCRGGLLAGD